MFTRIKHDDMCIVDGDVFYDGDREEIIMFDDCADCKCNVKLTFSHAGTDTKEMTSKDNLNNEVIGMFKVGKGKEWEMVD